MRAAVRRSVSLRRSQAFLADGAVMGLKPPPLPNTGVTRVPVAGVYAARVVRNERREPPSRGRSREVGPAIWPPPYALNTPTSKAIRCGHSPQSRGRAADASGMSERAPTSATVTRLAGCCLLAALLVPGAAHPTHIARARSAPESLA
jgi:hypothetical protein